MIDTISILITSMLIVYAILKAYEMDRRERKSAQQAPSPWRPHEPQNRRPDA